ncbi:MAG: hypothetical protein RSG77_14945 [Hafnia sp.]
MRLDETFLGNPEFLKRFNHVMRSIMSMYRSGEQYIAVHIGDNEPIEKALAILLNTVGNRLELESIVLARDLPGDITLSPTSMEQFQLPFSMDEIHLLHEQDGQIHSSKGRSVPPPGNLNKTHLPMETAHGRWLLPKGLKFNFCYNEANRNERVRIEQFLFTTGTHYCPEVVNVFANALAKSPMLYTAPQEETLVLFNGQESRIEPLVENDRFSIYEFIDSAQSHVLANCNGTYKTFPLEDQQWIEFSQLFNLNIGEEAVQLHAPLKWILQANEIQVANPRDRLAAMSGMPEPMAAFFQRKGLAMNEAGWKAHEKANRSLASASDFFQLVRSDGELFLHRQLKWQDYYLKVEIDESRRLVATSGFSLRDPLPAMPITSLKKHLRTLNARLKNEQTIKPLKCWNREEMLGIEHGDIPVKDKLGTDTYAWNLFHPTPEHDLPTVWLHGHSETQQVILQGELDEDGRNLRVLEMHAKPREEGIDALAFVREVASQHGADAYLPEFSINKDLSDFQLGDYRKNYQQVLSIFSSAYDNKDEVRVDLKVRFNNDFRQFSYGFVGLDHIPKRYVKAAIEAMAIRHVLIEHYSSKSTILKGSQHLRLDLSSKMLYEMLKGQQSIPDELWQHIRYVRTRSYNGRFTLNVEAPKRLVDVSRLIDMNQPRAVMEYDESLKMNSGNYHVTHHAVERSDQRMYNEGSMTGWGFITSQILKSFSHEAEFAKLDQRDKIDSKVYINEENWNFAMRKGDSDKVRTIATIFEGIYPDQIHHKSAPRANRLGKLYPKQDLAM